MNACVEELFESYHVRTSTKIEHTVLDGKYEDSNLNKVMKNQYQHLTQTQRNELLKFLQKIELLLYGTLDTWKTDAVGFELK